MSTEQLVTVMPSPSLAAAAAGAQQKAEALALDQLARAGEPIPAPTAAELMAPVQAKLDAANAELVSTKGSLAEARKMIAVTAADRDAAESKLVDEAHAHSVTETALDAEKAAHAVTTAKLASAGTENETMKNDLVAVHVQLAATQKALSDLIKVNPS